MKKLCIAVIVLSFFGVGPLKSFFQNTVGVDGKQLIQTLKEKSKVTGNRDHITNYLILEKTADKLSPQTAMMLEYNSAKNMLHVGSLAIPASINNESIKQVKDAVNQKYHITVQHCFLFEADGIAKIIDLLAPDGVQLSSEIPGLKGKTINGRELVAYLEKQSQNPQNNPDISKLLSSLKEEIMKNQSPEKLITIAPAILSEASSSITTDLGNEQLMSLGVTALMNPVKSIEVIQLKEGKNVAKPVNLQLDSAQ